MAKGNPVEQMDTNERVRHTVAIVGNRLKKLNEQEQQRVLNVLTELYVPAVRRDA